MNNHDNPTNCRDAKNGVQELRELLIVFAFQNIIYPIDDHNGGLLLPPCGSLLLCGEHAGLGELCADCGDEGLEDGGGGGQSGGVVWDRIVCARNRHCVVRWSTRSCYADGDNAMAFIYCGECRVGKCCGGVIGIDIKDVLEMIVLDDLIRHVGEHGSGRHGEDISNC